jgi:selenocysteine lyase/cysteine desulfurase
LNEPGFDIAALRHAYSGFLKADRILLSGHSHQAWPDVARDALVQVFDDAAARVDDKWDDFVFPKMASVGSAILQRSGFERDDPIAFGRSTHELVFRLLSCFRAHERPRIVTTTGEFHSLYRQLTRLEEEGVQVEWVNARPRETLADRVLEALRPGTSLLAISAVLFEDAYIVPRLEEIAARAVTIGALPLIDAYHAFNVVPVAWGPARDRLYVTAGGYKYAGFGEGLCWMRFPRDCELRPVDTGWFADFAALSSPRTKVITYGHGGARFAGATFDPAALYRAEAVLGHWDRFALSVPRLRAISTRQTRRVLARFAAKGRSDEIISSDDDARRGGFVTVVSHEAPDVVARLRKRGVLVDARGDTVRIGPAPYLLDEEIDNGTDAVLDELARRR